MQTPWRISEAARRRVLEATPERVRVLQAVAAGRPLDAEPNDVPAALCVVIASTDTAPPAGTPVGTVVVRKQV